MINHDLLAAISHISETVRVIVASELDSEFNENGSVCFKAMGGISSNTNQYLLIIWDVIKVPGEEPLWKHLKVSCIF